MQNLISRIGSWFTVPRNRYRFIIGAVGVFVLLGVVLFSSQIGNLLSLFGSRAFLPEEAAWQGGLSVPGGGNYSETVITVDSDGTKWLYSVGGLDSNNQRLSSVHKLQLSDDGTPAGNDWETCSDMIFQRAGHRLVIYNDYIYAIAGDIHIATDDSDTDNIYPLVYSTIERFNLREWFPGSTRSAGWEVIARMTGVNFFPEVYLDDNQLHIVGGVYGRMPNMGIFGNVFGGGTINIDNKPLINGVPLRVNGKYADVLSESITSTEISHGMSPIYGQFYTTVSEHYKIDLSNPNSYTVGELGSDGGEICEECGDDGCLLHWGWFNQRVPNAEMKMGHLRFKFILRTPTSGSGSSQPVAIPLPQGRYGHKIFSENGNLFVVGGASWSAPIEFDGAIIHPFWVITDGLFPKFDQDNIPLGRWENDYVGNTVYQWNGTSWSGTGHDSTLGNKYSLQVTANSVTSGLAFSGMGNLGSEDNVKKIVIGGIRNRTNKLKSYTTGGSAWDPLISHYYMELDEVADVFTFTNNDGWVSTSDYEYEHFLVDVVDMRDSVIAFGGQRGVSAGEEINGWPSGSMDGETSTSVFDGQNWGQGQVSNHKNMTASVAVTSATSARVVIYRVGNSAVEYLGPLTRFNIPVDPSNSNLFILPYGGIPDGATPRLGDDGHAFTAAVFRLKDSDGEPVSNIQVGISSASDDILVCRVGEEYISGGCNYSPGPSGVFTDESGIAIVYIKSKDELQPDELPRNKQIDITGFYIIPDSDGTLSNPTGTLASVQLELSGEGVPFNSNTEVCFVREEGTDCDDSRSWQVFPDSIDQAIVEVRLKDGDAQDVNSEGYEIMLTAYPDRQEDLITPIGLSSDGNAQFTIKSELYGEIKLQAEYRPKFSLEGEDYDWLVDHQPWVPIFNQDKQLIVQFAGRAGTLSPGHVTRDNQEILLAATGNQTRWLDGNGSIIGFVASPVEPAIKFSRLEGGGLDELSINTQYSFELVLDGYADKLIELSLVEGGGTLTPQSVITDANGEAKFEYITSATGGIKKIRATTADGKIDQELWLTVQFNDQQQDLYTLDISPSPSEIVLGIDNPHILLRTRLIDGDGNSVTDTNPPPTFEFSNNDDGTFYKDTYNQKTGIAQVVYTAAVSGEDAEIFIEATYGSIHLVKRVSIDGIDQSLTDTVITYRNFEVVNDTTFALEIDVGSNAKVGFWTLQARFLYVDTYGQDTFPMAVTYNFTFEVKPLQSDIIYSLKSPAGYRGGDFTVSIAGINTQFDTTGLNPIVKFTPVTSNDESGIEIVSAIPQSPTDLQVDIIIADNATIGYWNVEVQVGSTIYTMPGDFDFLVMPDDPSGYFMNLVIGTYEDWELGTLPADGEASIELVATVEKFDAWTDSGGTSLNDIEVAASITSGTGDIEPAKPVSQITKDDNGAAFTYTADLNSGDTSVLFETTVVDIDLDLNVTTVLTKVITDYKGTFEVIANPAIINLNGTDYTSVVTVTLLDESGDYIDPPVTVNLSLSGDGYLASKSINSNGGSASTVYHYTPPIGGAIEGISTVNATTVIAGVGTVSTQALGKGGTGAVIERSFSAGPSVVLNLEIPLEGNIYDYRTKARVRAVVMKKGSMTPSIDDLFMVDSANTIKLTGIFVDPGAVYNVWVNPPYHLAVGATFTAPTENDETITPKLVSDKGEELSYIGDIEPNNNINTFDYQKFVGQMFKGLLAPIADFNGDGDVNILDWPFMFNNYWKQGYSSPFPN